MSGPETATIPLVERLRRAHDRLPLDGAGKPYEHSLYSEAAQEIEVLRHVIRSLHEQGRIINGPMPWMRHSPADEAYDRALGRENGSSSEGDR